MEILVDVGEYVVSKNKDDTLKIYGLSSCIGMVMYCMPMHVLGVAHILLPSSETNPELSKISPGYFADTAIDAMLNEFITEYGCKKEYIITEIYGGAVSKSNNDIFNIGNRNIKAVKRKISEHNLILKKSDVGGKCSRTLQVHVGTGKVNIKVMNYL